MLGQRMIVRKLLGKMRHEFCVHHYFFETHGFEDN